MNKVITATVLFLATIVALPLAAQDLISTSRSDACATKWASNFDTCTIIRTSDAADPDDICQYRQRAGITSTYDSANNVLVVDLDPLAGSAKGILYRPSEPGFHSDRAQFEARHWQLLTGDGCPGVEVPEPLTNPNYCGTLDIEYVERGSYHWYDRSTSSWSSSQDFNPVYGALVSDSGEVFWDETPVMELDLELACSIFGEYPLRALHCAEVGTVTATEEIEAPCENFSDYLFSNPYAGSRFKWYEIDGERITVADNDTGNGDEFVRYDVLPDEAEMYNKTYRLSSSYPYAYQSRAGKPPFGKTYSPRDGVCAIGRVENSGFIREGGYISAGSAPSASSCPAAPNWP